MILYTTFQDGTHAEHPEADNQETAQDDEGFDPALAKYEDLVFQELDNTEDALLKQFYQANHPGELKVQSGM